MINKNKKSASEVLRFKAEEVLINKPSSSTSQLSVTDMVKLIHELEVHQIELEMMNEELNLSRTTASEAAERYTDLYEFAPVGLFTLSKDGRIAEMNLHGSIMIGKERKHLINSLFEHCISQDAKPVFSLFLHKVHNSTVKETCEVTLDVTGNIPMYVHLTGISTENGDQCLLTAVDITERKQAENDALQTTSALTFLAQYSGIKTNLEFFPLLAQYLANALDANFVCIDRLEGDGLNATTLAVWHDGAFEDNVVYALKDTPCGDVVGKTVCCFPASVTSFFPKDTVLQDLKAESYVGVTLWSHTGTPIGLIAVIKNRPLQNQRQAEELMKLVAVRAAGELERIDAEVELRMSENRYRLLAENITDVIWVLDPVSMRFLYASPSVEQLLGYTPVELLALPFTEILIPEIREPFIERTRERVAHFLAQPETGTGYRNEVVHLRKDGSSIETETVNRYYLNADTGLVEIQGVSRDITERKQKEKEIFELNRDLDLHVKQRTAELEKVNKELETFSYSVSHDLKAPLRHIIGFIDLLFEKKSKYLSDEELGYLDVISSSASDMGKLIDGILNFSRLNAIELQKTRIPSAKMVQQVIKFFDSEIQNRDVTFKVASLPDVSGDEELIRVVWTNLISNAIKYTRKKLAARIEIGFVSTDNESTFFIKDNGAGFNMKNARKLFGVFQRLHKPSEFEGAGIGLANVNRIITRHGGQCRAEGEENIGATFYFSLPK